VSIPHAAARLASEDRAANALVHAPRRLDATARRRNARCSASAQEAAMNRSHDRSRNPEHYGARSLRGYQHDEVFETQDDRVNRARYEMGMGGLPSTYGNVPYAAPPREPDPQPWRGRDEETDFWGQPRHPHQHGHAPGSAHPSLWARVKGAFTGHGPKGYVRSDERIREEVCEHLADHPYIDAREIEVSVVEGEVTLSGFVDARIAKRAAEDCADHVRGVKDVHNRLRVQKPAPAR
jgi:BON domain